MLVPKTDEKMSILINPKLHRRIKLHCVNREVLIQDFVEKTLEKELNKPVRK